MRHDATARGKFDTPPVQSRAFGLHAKYMVIDRRFTFVGSLNLDPRSIYINTEMGMIIDSPKLARRRCAGIRRRNETRKLLAGAAG